MNDYRASWKTYANEQLRQACNPEILYGQSFDFLWPWKQHGSTWSNLLVAESDGQPEELISHADAMKRIDNLESQKIARMQECAVSGGQHRSDIHQLLN